MYDHLIDQLSPDQIKFLIDEVDVHAVVAVRTLQDWLNIADTKYALSVMRYIIRIFGGGDE